MQHPTRSIVKKEKESLLIRHPGSVLAFVSLLSVIFGLGASWAAANARISRLEEVTSTLASKEELATLNESIKKVDQKLDLILRFLRKE